MKTTIKYVSRDKGFVYTGVDRGRCPIEEFLMTKVSSDHAKGAFYIRRKVNFPPVEDEFCLVDPNTDQYFRDVDLGEEFTLV